VDDPFKKKNYSWMREEAQFVCHVFVDGGEAGRRRNAGRPVGFADSALVVFFKFHFYEGA